MYRCNRNQRVKLLNATLIMSLSSRRSLVYIANSLQYYRNYEACFSSTSHKIQGGITPGNPRDRDTRVSAGVSNVDNKATLGKSGGEEYRRKDMEGAGGDAAEMAKAGVVGAVEAGLKFGEMAKQTMDAAWYAAKTTAESIRDENIQKSNEDINHVEDLRRRARGYDVKNEHQTMDAAWDSAKKTAESVRDETLQKSNEDIKHVEDQRRWARGYDVKDEHNADKHVEDLRRQAGGYDLKDH